LIDKWIDKIVKKEEELEAENEGKEDTSQQSNMAAPLIMTTDSAAAVGSSPAPAKPSPMGRKKKESAIVARFLEGYYKGKEDTLLREAYFKAKTDSGLTNGVFGGYLYHNSTYSIKEDKNKNGGEYSTYSVLRQQKIIEKKKRLKEEERKQKKENKEK